MANTDLKRNTSTESAREMWNAVDSAAEKAPQWIKDKMNVANTDERLKALKERTIKDGIHDNLRFAAQKALEAREALRRIRDVCNPETPFTRAVSKPVLKAMVELIDKVLED